MKKQIRHIYLFLGVMAQVLASCNSGNAPKPAPESVPPPAAGAAALKPEVSLYMVIAEDLLLRTAPSQTGSTMVTKLKSGEFVQGTGEVSSNKEEAVIHDIPMKEPFYQVVTTTPEQFKGWAFGGGLVRVYAGKRAESPDLGKLSPYAQFLRPLPVNHLESGKAVWDYVKGHFADAKGTVADAAFIMTESYLHRMEASGEFYNLTENTNWSDEDQDAIYKHTFNPEKYPIARTLAENGFTLSAGEGMVFPTVDDQKLHDFFAPKTTPAMKAFLDQSLEEDLHQAWEDGGIIIPMEQIADRGAFWEKFNKDNPFFVLSDRTVEFEHWTKLMVLNGDSNTPAYDESTGAVDEAFKKAWSYVLQKYPGTDLARAVKQISDLYAAEGWKHSEKVEEFLKQFQEED